MDNTFMQCRQKCKSGVFVRSSVLRRPGSCERSLQFILKKRTAADSMDRDDYLQQYSADSLSLEEKPEIKPVGVHQLQDADINRTDDVQQLVVIKEEAPWDQHDSEPLHIKTEQEELWASHEEDHLNGFGETENTRFPFNILVKSEDDDEKPHFSQLHKSQTKDCTAAEPPTSSLTKWIKIETHGEDGGGLELARKPDPSTHLETNIDKGASDSSETEVSDDDWQGPLSESGPETEDSENGWKETRKPESGVPSDAGHNTPKKNFSCSACGKQFVYKQSLKRHIRRNSENGSSSCLDNMKCFKRKQSIDSHIKIYTGEKPFGCGFCGKRVKYLYNLKSHMRVHTGEKLFGCDVCGKRFTHHQNLKTHVTIHSGEKPFVCDICGKRARHQNNLKIHMIAHTGEKPFGCDDCGKRFKRKTHLTTHMTVHTAEKPFGCDVCGKRFNRKSHLRTHMIVHTGEKPYGCDVCGKKFNRKTHLESHITVHTGEKPFGCAICDQGFTQQGSLNRHMRFHLG